MEWYSYYELEPFGEVRADMRSAQIVWVLANIHRGRNKPKIKFDDCLLKFGPEEVKPKKKQTSSRQWELLLGVAAQFEGEMKKP